MNKAEFIARYHDYHTTSEYAAKTEAILVNEEGIEDDEAIAVRFGSLGLGLMLRSAIEFLQENSK